jgi:hypothetical protein
MPADMSSLQLTIGDRHEVLKFFPNLPILLAMAYHFYSPGCREGERRMDRKGEKIGWIGGWTGGFLWVLAFGVIWFVQGKPVHGVIGSALFLAALFLIVRFAPWKHANTKYWKLMLPVYVMFLLSASLIVYAMGGFSDLSKIQYGLWIIPCLSPLIVLGNRTWE